MAEPQPAQVREGADVEDEAPAIPSNAEDRKAAAALSSLGARGDDDDGPSKRPDIDQEALGQAISRLEVGSRVPGNSKAKGNNDGEVEKKKPAVKVDQADVALLVSIQALSGNFEHGSEQH